MDVMDSDGFLPIGVPPFPTPTGFTAQDLTGWKYPQQLSKDYSNCKHLGGNGEWGASSSPSPTGTC